jgi:2-dehydro-3-deoxygluconokinase
MGEGRLREPIQGKALRVVAAGECMLELSRQGGLWRLGAAGDSFNTALYMARLGASVRYLTALGQDPFSQEMLRSWAEEGLDTSLVLRDPERLPGLYAIRTDDHGERSFFYWRQHAAVRQLLQLPGSAAVLQAASECDLLYLTGITLSLFDESDRRRWLELATEVRGRGGLVAFDPNYRPRGWSSVAEARAAFEAMATQVSIWLTTDDDERQLFGDGGSEQVCDRWRRAGVGEVVVKQGAAGVAVQCGTESATVAIGASVPVVDTTGAGDSFNAAYLLARLRGAGVRRAAEAGNQLAGEVVQVPGAILPRERMPVSRD